MDIMLEKVEMINNHKSPIQEDYIEKYLAGNKLNLTATLEAELAYSNADFVIMATPTVYSTKLVKVNYRNYHGNELKMSHS